MDAEQTSRVSPRYVYLVSRYPAVTHTFIAQELQALRRRGVAIETASIRRAAAGELLSDADRAEFESTHSLVPARPLELVAAHLRALLGAPLGYLATLFDSLRWTAGGPRAALWQLFYFAEAMLLWRWMSLRGLRHIHVHFPNVASDVALLTTRYANRSRRGSGWTWSMTLHGPTEFFDVGQHKLALKVSHAAAVICISDFTRTQVMACCLPEDWGRLHVIRCGVDTAHFTPANRLGQAEAGSTRPWRVLNVAALSARKGQMVLLGALKLLLERGHEVTLEIVGDGPDRDAVEGEIRRLGIERAVTMRGALPRDAVRDRYGQADAFCLPSFSEGVPIVLMEAMACGLPVVATHINGVPELIEHERSGLLVAPGRCDHLADALERLLLDPALSQRLASAGRERVIDRFELNQTAERVGAVLASVAGRCDR